MTNELTLYDAATSVAAEGQDVNVGIAVWPNGDWMESCEAYEEMDAGCLSKSDDFIVVEPMLLAEFSDEFAEEYFESSSSEIWHANNYEQLVGSMSDEELDWAAAIIEAHGDIEDIDCPY